MEIELFTDRLKLKDILPEKAKDIAKQYKLKVNEIEFIRKKNPLKAEDMIKLCSLFRGGNIQAVRSIFTV